MLYGVAGQTGCTRFACVCVCTDSGHLFHHLNDINKKHSKILALNL